ncbi:Uncharacterized protein family UPF0114 [Dillenia turbinata]|uniref:Uncharacterized protein family UPF0114 n=1 Tax=Dillenia turbinata TaxID=194707 RepID=A0AAN8VHD7_9MAGN
MTPSSSSSSSSIISRLGLGLSTKPNPYRVQVPVATKLTSCSGCVALSLNSKRMVGFPISSFSSSSSSHDPSSTSTKLPDSRTATLQTIEDNIEKVHFLHYPLLTICLFSDLKKIWDRQTIYRCRFLTLLGVWGSLVGSLLCFVKGSTYIVASFFEYFVNRAKVIMLLVEAIDVYLLGTVMLVFGMGLYELFVSNLDIAKSFPKDDIPHRSNLFGLFTLLVGHVIVMLLLIGLFDKSKKAAINTPVDLLCFSASVLLSSGCLYLLSKLNGPK